MSRKADKPPRQKQHTHELLDEGADEENIPQRRRGAARGHVAQHQKMEETAALRARSESGQDIDALPIGQVLQVYSRYCQVSHPSGSRLCVVRKTLTKLEKTAIVVGDQVRFRDGVPGGEPVVEQILPRRTILTRADSFKANQQHPIVANAEQMLIVASLVLPAVKWGLVDRMIVAAKSGGLEPIVCLNKIDLAEEEMASASAVLDYYATMGICCFKVSATDHQGLEALGARLKDKMTVLAGHSGVGKSSVIAAIQPGLDIRIGDISEFTLKGRHTTTSARRYELAGGGCVDTPGVKLFGLWDVTAENLLNYFPDVQGQTAPPWREESYQRIADSLRR